MLSVDRIDAAYDESTVLRGVSINAKKNQVTCILGRNGVGKSTLIKSIMGVLKVQEGRLTFNDKDITKAIPAKRARAGMSYVPQGREIFSSLTVEENLLLGLEANQNKKTDIFETIYRYFPVLKEMKNRKGGDLSGGQQQQLAIGRALAAEPALLLLDEPAEGIQPNIVEDIQQVIIDLKQNTETAMILVEQNIEFARSVGDYFYVMDRGRIMFEGPELVQEELEQYLSI
ncbi:urea ABC transporter ATP-binding protein [Sinobaca qinghaiensis]|uniref:Urea ABC transporter ATP-binding protein n=1 Tax=Sinobaca qinghaiensis TaxID=342944 RepID=A0A419UZW7_9BACL|nr:urea ABC transporter ATP-binding subunit UrtE [Sinobaca qinghaiensis]RKD71232.1 urea ABC transporter ATP-binding protein [Sinobaca qinghaiensis]